jgi:outer membrane protein assembly factor BamD
MKQIVFFLLIVLTLVSCKYQKILKNPDPKARYKAALEYYEKQDYTRAITLFEGLLPLFKGTDKEEDVNFYNAQSYYKSGDYLNAGYYFKNFAKTYVNSKHVEEVEYLAAYCYYLDSPRYTLDQGTTQTAISELLLFINKYPNSAKVGQCTALLEALRRKLEKKAYYGAKMYYDIGDYRAASISLKNALKDYPDSQYREELLYLVIRSSYLFAKNSVPEKQVERYKEAIKVYLPFKEEFPTSKYLKETDKIYAEIKKYQE